MELRLIGLITLVNVAVGVVVGGLLYDFAPEHYFKWYPSIPLFYWLMAIAMAFFLNLVKQKKGDVTVTTYMIVRFCKFTLALALCCICRRTTTNIRIYHDAVLFHLLRDGNLYSIFIRKEKDEQREKREK